LQTETVFPTSKKENRKRLVWHIIANAKKKKKGVYVKPTTTPHCNILIYRY